ncbi:MAG: tRNA (adenosine(37)-N6)-threonylcarbamoyltransferase complex dimerization subunit type 1 TsaB, partial [Myxococcales bacterium]
MLLLGLDTATLTLSAALVERDGEGRDTLLERVVEPPPKQHSVLLPGVLEALLKRRGARLGDVGA